MYSCSSHEVKHISLHELFRANEGTLKYLDVTIEVIDKGTIHSCSSHQVTHPISGVIRIPFDNFRSESDPNLKKRFNNQIRRKTVLVVDLRRGEAQ